MLKLLQIAFVGCITIITNIDIPIGGVRNVIFGKGEYNDI